MEMPNPSCTCLLWWICTVKYCRSDRTWPQNEGCLQKLPLGTLHVSALMGRDEDRDGVCMRVCVLYAVAAVTICPALVCTLDESGWWKSQNDVGPFSLHLPFLSPLCSVNVGLRIHTHTQLNRLGHGLLIQPNETGASFAFVVPTHNPMNVY